MHSPKVRFVQDLAQGSVASFYLRDRETPILTIERGTVKSFCPDSATAAFDLPNSVQAIVSLSDRTHACRLQPGTDDNVVQLGIGRVTSRLMDSLYDPISDTAIQFDADELEMRWDDAVWRVRVSGLRQIVFFADFLRSNYQLDYYQPLDRTVFDRAPAGWCSWTAYLEPDWNAGVGLSEDQVMLNVDWAAKHLKRYGLKFIQIDDGWQGDSPYITRNIAQQFTAEQQFSGIRLDYRRGGTCVWRLRESDKDGRIIATGTWNELQGEGSAEAVFDAQPGGRYWFETIAVPGKPGVSWHSTEADSSVDAAVYLDGRILPNVQIGFSVRYEDGWHAVVSAGSSLLSLPLNAGGTFKNRSFDAISPKFPGGMKRLADYIKSKGFEPGIWLVPFGQSDPELFDAVPQMFLRDHRGWSPLAQPEYGKDGKLGGPVYWLGRYCIDPTTEEAKQYLRTLFTRIAHDWGYTYVKIDGQGHALRVLAQHLDLLHEPVKTPIEAYRSAVEVMKEAVGKEVFLLNCGGVYNSCGLCEGIRTGADIVPRWEGVLRCVRATAGSLLFNSNVFWTDPDMICVRNDIPYEHAQAWATYLAITGQLLMVSDRLYDLHEDRIELLRRIMPVADIHPAELYRLNVAACIYDLKVNKPGVGSWDVVGVFNWTDTVEQHQITPDRLGLEQGEYIFYDVWNKELVGVGESLEVTLMPTSCRVIGMYRKSGRPQVIGTSRHVTQGADDLLEVNWDPELLRLTGSSRVVAGDPYEIRVFIPDGWSCCSASDWWTVSGRVATLQIDKDVDCTVDWAVEFDREER